METKEQLVLYIATQRLDEMTYKSIFEGEDYDKLIRSMISHKEKQERDNKIHMVVTNIQRPEWRNGIRTCFRNKVL